MKKTLITFALFASFLLLMLPVTSALSPKGPAVIITPTTAVVAGVILVAVILIICYFGGCFGGGGAGGPRTSGGIQGCIKKCVAGGGDYMDCAEECTP